MSKTGVDFVIGGKDNATPALESADKSMGHLEEQMFQFKLQSQMSEGAMQEFNKTIQNTGSSAEKVANNSISKLSSSMEASAGAAVDAISLMSATAVAGVAVLLGLAAAATAAVYTLVKLYKGSKPFYDAQTESVRQLNSALQIRGASVASQQMQDLAKNLEKLTGVSDNVTLGLMHQASGMGFAAGAMDDAAKAAIGLSYATGQDASTSLNDLKSALEGNFDAFTHINPQILYMRTNQEKLAAVMRIAQQGLQDQSGNMLTVAGSGLRLNTAFQTLMESIGKIFAPLRVLINSGLMEAANALDSILAPAVQWATGLLENIGPVVDWVKEKVIQAVNAMIAAWTFLEVILTNLGSVWDLVASSAELAMIQITESVMHALTVEIPAYAEWWAENLTNIFRTAFSLVYTIVSNHILKLIDAFKSLWEFIASGGQTDIMAQLGEISGRSYLDGFESSLTEFPEIAVRQLTQREQDLADKIGAIGGRLGQEFSDKMSERMMGVGSGLSDELKKATTDISLKSRMSVMTTGTQATEGRLLTRGPGSGMTIPQWLGLIANKIDKLTNKPGLQNDDKATIDAIKNKAQKQVNLVPVT